MLIFEKDRKTPNVVEQSALSSLTMLWGSTEFFEHEKWYTDKETSCHSAPDKR